MPGKINEKTYTLAYYIQNAEYQRGKKNLESSQRKKQLTYGDIKIGITFNFSDTMQATIE